jgi:hypothetical protein
LRSSQHRLRRVISGVVYRHALWHAEALPLSNSQSGLALAVIFLSNGRRFIVDFTGGRLTMMAIVGQLLLPGSDGFNLAKHVNGRRLT